MMDSIPADGGRGESALENDVHRVLISTYENEEMLSMPYKDLTSVQKKARRILCNKEKNVSLTSEWDERLQKKVVYGKNSRGQIWVCKEEVNEIINFQYQKMKGGNSKVLHQVRSRTELIFLQTLSNYCLGYST